ncbi:thiolase domain-containing protein [Candidimonas sp. SYP-B2681]|uniref:thiolase domain-containing protein n=1 Tax=Candidimonas sp. SYP-B2681 TaxID=2497686 RepID=UPI000F860BAC|nr:thiolase domain-containing protein [Candidimonas sp. SYP-B2681]RTZ45482.1 thiolase domain-containing protein [Candidimonas sp. SYP-B2681]
MTIKDKAYIVGAYEHPLRHAPNHSVAQLHAEVAKGAIEDAGLSKDDIDGFFCAGDAPGGNAWSMANYLNLSQLKHIDSTDMGGCSYLIHVAHAAQAIALGKCNVALITLAGRPKSDGISGTQVRIRGVSLPEAPYELPYSPVTLNLYAMAAMRHMYEFGTTSEQLAWIKVAASHHAQYNEKAMLRDLVSVEDVLASPMISDPLRRLDSCVVTDGGGAIIVARRDIARALNRPRIKVIGAGETTKHQSGGKVDLSYTGVAWAGQRAFEEAGVKPGDIQYASIYDSFTITVLLQLEDLGFCPKGEGGRFVADGNLISGQGRLPFNTDGGGLCNNHPSNRGGMTKIIEAVRQLRGEAHPRVQVPGCSLALASGIGGAIGHRHGAATIIMERE